MVDFLDDVFGKIEAKTEELKNDPSASYCENFLSIHSFKVNSLKELINNPPINGNIYFLWTDSSFNAFTVIPYILKEFNVIDELILSTYSINQRILDSFSRYIHSGRIHSVDILCSETLKMRMPKVADQLQIFSNIKSNNFNLRYSWNHSKVTLIKTNNNYFIFEGSGNWSENSRNEQYIFANSESVYNFRKSWIKNGII